MQMNVGKGVKDQNGWSTAGWVVLLIATVVARLIAGWIFAIYDVVNDSGIAVKPFGEPAYLDYKLYSNSMADPWSPLLMPAEFMRKLIGDPQLAWNWLKERPIRPGPIFPALLDISGYEVDRKPLACLYMLLGLVLGLLWAIFSYTRGYKYSYQIVLACFPTLVYYSFLVSTDLLYAFVVAMVYIGCWNIGKADRDYDKWNVFFLGVSLLLAVMIRPNALSLVPFVWVIIVSRYRKLGSRILFTIFLSGLTMTMLIYYLPYFWVHEKNGSVTHYLWRYPEEFYRGVFGGMPLLLNKLLSLVVLFLLKLLYSVGLRPSYGDISTWLTLFRALPGIVMLPGMVYLFANGKNFDRAFMFMFLLPVYVGASQERYLLPVTPLLVLYGINMYKNVFFTFRKRLGGLL